MATTNSPQPQPQTMVELIDEFIDRSISYGEWPLDRPTVRALEDLAISRAAEYAMTPAQAVELVQTMVSE